MDQSDLVYYMSDCGVLISRLSLSKQYVRMLEANNHVSHKESLLKPTLKANETRHFVVDTSIAQAVKSTPIGPHFGDYSGQRRVVNLTNRDVRHSSGQAFPPSSVLSRIDDHF